MNSAKVLKNRDAKESVIIDAAEKIFEAVGFTNAKMDDIAEEAGMSKGSVYFYFDTKDNLYMAVVYRAIQLLNKLLYQSIALCKDQKGAESVLQLMSVYMNYSQDYRLYSEAILDYLSINRSSGQGQNKAKLTMAIKESVYWLKIKDIQNIPFKLVIGEITRGKADGSIKSKEKAELLYLIAWANVIGFIKLNASYGKHDTFHGVSIEKWKNYHIDVARTLLNPGL